MPCVSTKLKANVIALATIVAWCEDMVESAPTELAKPVHMQRVRHMCNHATKLLDMLMDGLDEDAFLECTHHLRTREIAFVPKEDARRKGELLVVLPEDLTYVLESSITACPVCLLDEREVKQCRLRKVLVRMGAMPIKTPRGSCPWQP